MRENTTKMKIKKVYATNCVTFKHKGQILCEYKPFQGYAEIRETIKLLAYEKGINEEEIIAKVVIE